jgi:hypothetical protein
MQTYLQLCDLLESSKYGATQCYWLFGGCQGSPSNNCSPRVIWSGTRRSTNNYEQGWLGEGIFYTSDATDPLATNAYSVRCVLDLSASCDFITTAKELQMQYFTMQRICRRLSGRHI